MASGERRGAEQSVAEAGDAYRETPLDKKLESYNNPHSSSMECGGDGMGEALRREDNTGMRECPVAPDWDALVETFVTMSKDEDTQINT
ncbi:hypothetical protein NDU88_006538 [Pleurodeles waltl]|uniref:Uncharacterized protein n=1 Tax=Pleurodeles waltl TaxID=8319 RepID=A0AAV7VQ26_PLEWA|nr:hypothetical protein NDU88_006538 [Pleurodeles waltl]